MLQSPLCGSTAAVWAHFNSWKSLEKSCGRNTSKQTKQAALNSYLQYQPHLLNKNMKLWRESNLYDTEVLAWHCSWVSSLLVLLTSDRVSLPKHIVCLTGAPRLNCQWEEQELSEGSSELRWADLHLKVPRPTLAIRKPRTMTHLTQPRA